MATMLKEKRREKKKNKEKNSVRSSLSVNLPSSSAQASLEECTTPQLFENVPENSQTERETAFSAVSDEISTKKDNQEIHCCNTENTSFIDDEFVRKTEENVNDSTQNQSSPCIEITVNPSQVKLIEIENKNRTYRHLSEALEQMAVLDPASGIEGQISVLESHQESQNSVELTCLESVIPSAPMFEENFCPQAPVEREEINYVKPKQQCMPLEEACRVFGGIEMAAVKATSEREEATVQAGLLCGPEHPLVELLNTFRYSLISVERERSRLASDFSEEEISRATLWKIEKQNLQLKKNCKCGAAVELKASYEHAQLIKERLPVAKLKLEGLLKDVQETYCHYQHEALLAHFQIEEHIAESIQSNKSRIREDLTLLLQELRNSDGAPEALPSRLQHWAAALASALVDGRDLSQLLFLIHHLFRQTRSVRWAARALRAPVTDSVTAARALAVLDTLLSKLRLETAVECIEEADEQWEELGIRGTGGAVSSGTLRERDLIALLRALPLQDLIAKMVLFSHADFRQAREYEWGDASGGNGLLKSCCGVRALLSVLQRAVTLHASYGRLHTELRHVARSALTSLACLYHTPRAAYYTELEGKITAELETAFAEGFVLFGTHDLHTLPTTLLTEDTAKDYCLTFITGIHEKSRKLIECLSVEAPVLSCDQRVRIVTQAAVDRDRDRELPKIVLDFLLQSGVKRKIVRCVGGCETTARECLPKLLTAHPHLHTVALLTVAHMTQAENLEPNTVSLLHVNKWRPSVEEVQAVLQEWSRRCPEMLPQLLLQLDYTPHVGVSLQVQLHIADWLCPWSKIPGNTEHAWRILLRMRTHRACWLLTVPYAEPPPADELDVFCMARAVLCGEWGGTIPLICSQGVSALCAISVSRPREAVHCLAPVMLAMSPSPQSVSLTPKFTELFTILLSHGPSLVQRAFGRGPVSGAELLLRLVLTQVENKQHHTSVFPVWLHALWKVPSALHILDIAALAARDWPSLDSFAVTLLHEENHKEHVTNAVRYASTAPLLCECLLRAAHAHEMNSHLFPALVTAVVQQRAASQRIHVDNALQKINAKISSEELIIFRCASAAISAPLDHPSHLTLWRLFVHMYLQRPPDLLHNNSPPGGPLFFSGIRKSRVLSQIKKRLQETATHHHNQSETYKKDNNSEPTPRTSNRVVKSESITIDSDILPPVTVKDLTGESETEFERDSECDTDSGEEREANITIDSSTEEAVEMEKKRNHNMACYHTAAERLIREYLCWLEEGEKVQALPHHADIARFIPEQALEEAWKDALSRLRPPPSAELDDFPRPAEPPPYTNEVPKTPLSTALDSIRSVKCRSSVRSRRIIRSKLENVDFKDRRTLINLVDKHLTDLEKYAQEWDMELARISSLDTRLWELVSVLRVPRLLPPVKKACPNKCGNIIFHLTEQEWCISIGAERGIKENRSAYWAGVCRLTKARPTLARTSTALTTIASRILKMEDVVKVLEIAWRFAGICTQCSSAHAALIDLFQELCVLWIQRDGKLCAELISKWCSDTTTAVQQTLCGLLICPRELQPGHMAAVYTALLNANLPPHTKFSYLSKFEMRKWIETMDGPVRHTLIETLLATSQRYRPEGAPNLMLLELIAVHSGLLINGQELCSAVVKCARASVARKLPPDHWRHVIQAAMRHAKELTLDQLGHLLREIGTVWWETRSSVRNVETSAHYAKYAEYTAELLSCLISTFVDTAVDLSYVPETAGWFAWSVLQESWSAWIAPPSILPPTGESHHYLQMLARFKDCIVQIMLHCRGSEAAILQLSFNWAVATYRLVSQHSSQESRVQMSALLSKLHELPWTTHQWFCGATLQTQAEVLTQNDPELTTWCCETYRATRAEILLSNLEGERELGPRLADILYIFTGTLVTHQPEILEQACLLPWYRLNEAALAEALDRFFAVHHNPAVPYHDLPQFAVLLYAAELRLQPQYPATVHGKRARCVTAWTYSACAPPLQAHRPHQASAMLHTLTALAPRLENDDEIVDLLCRAIVLVNMEPEQSAVVPVWQNWVASAPARLVRACVVASSTVTAQAHAAFVADAAIRAHLHTCEGGWTDIRQCWTASCWKEPHLFVARGALFAAYACVTHSTHAQEATPALTALQLASSINFIENEAIVALWICYVARVARECATGATSDIVECRDKARYLLTSWGNQPRRSILKVVTLQADTDRPTPQHRLLIRLARCVLEPSTDTAQAYESACANLLGSTSDVIAWGKEACPRRLVRLAARLYPKNERYFQWELDLAPESIVL